MVSAHGVRGSNPLEGVFPCFLNQVGKPTAKDRFSGLFSVDQKR